MTYSLDIKPKLDEKFKKLIKKNRELYERTMEKAHAIADNPQHYKPLGNVMTGKRRVHVGSFVLIYSIDETRKAVILLDFEHHDKVYG